MKKFTLLISSLIVMIMVSCGPGKTAAVEYNGRIMDLVNKLTLSQNGFLFQIDGHNMDSLTMAQKSFSDNSTASLEEATKLDAFDGKTEYRDAAVAYFKTMKHISHHEAKQMAEIMAKDSAQLIPADLAKIVELSTRFDDAYERVFNDLLAAQAVFAKEWKFEIEKTKK